MHLWLPDVTLLRVCYGMMHYRNFSCQVRSRRDIVVANWQCSEPQYSKRHAEKRFKETQSFNLFWPPQPSDDSIWPGTINCSQTELFICLSDVTAKAPYKKRLRNIHVNALTHRNVKLTKNNSYNSVRTSIPPSYRRLVTVADVTSRCLHS